MQLLCCRSGQRVYLLSAVLRTFAVKSTNMTLFASRSHSPGSPGRVHPLLRKWIHLPEDDGNQSLFWNTSEIARNIEFEDVGLFLVILCDLSHKLLGSSNTKERTSPFSSCIVIVDEESL